MKSIKILLVALLLFIPAFSMAGDISDFEGGTKEVVVNLTAPNFEATVSITVPAGFWAANATMKVTGMAAEGNSSAYPENVVMKINETIIWAFQQSGFGPLGRQDRFSTGQEQASSSFGAGGGVKSLNIRLPKDAIMQSATMDVKGISPVSKQELADFAGEVNTDNLGYSVSSAGDVNNDGYDDVIVGAPGNDTGGSNAGRAYVYFGGPDMDATADVILTGAGTMDVFGDQVSGAGDVNGDGYDDVIVGADHNSSVWPYSGRAYIFFGGNSMDNIADVLLDPEAFRDHIGSSVSDAGDVNNDGYDDVIVGASQYDAGGNNTGRAYLFFGGQNMDNTSDVMFTGEAAGDYMGDSVSGAGDVNDDGYDDVVIGARYDDAGGSNSGRAYLFFGGQSMDNTSDVIFTGEAAGDSLGCSVSCAGDVNDDGFDDVIVGASGNDAGGDRAGQAYLYLGGQNVDNTADIIFTGGAASDALGSSVSSAGDMNRDGYDDVIIGAPFNNTGGTQAGLTYIYLGGQNMNNVTDLIFPGEGSSDNLGHSVSDAGDVNNDGYDDIIVGAHGNSEAATFAGRAYAYSLFSIASTGILNPGIAVGSKSIWTETGYYNDSTTLTDFASEINAYLGAAPKSGEDSCGNSYVDVPMTLNASGKGSLALYNLGIVYSYDAGTLDFSSALNNYVLLHINDTNAKDADGNIKVPVKVESDSAGRIKFSGLHISLDLPPKLLQKIPDVELDEDSWNLTLIDLYPHFLDDIDPDENLTFSVVSSTNTSYVRLFITGQRYLSADAMTYEDNDNWTGTVESVVACADRWGQKVESNRFMIVVKNVNDGPLITSAPVIDAEAGIPYLYNVTAKDGDRDKLRFSLSTAPANMTVDADTGAIRWMPQAGGDHAVTVAVSDGMVSAEQSYSIHVPNKAPRITSEPPLNATTGAMYIYNVIAVDDNQDPLTYSLGRNIDGMSIGRTNGTITWTPAGVDEYYVIVQVSDGKLKAEQKFDITVVQGNRAPRFTSKAVTAAIVGIPYEYAAKASDEDGDVLGFSLVAGPEGMELDNGTGKITWTPVYAGNFTVNIRVTDGREGETFQEFVIRVAEAVLPRVTVLFPSEGQKVKGAIELRGTATKGTHEVVRVEVKVDSGDWQPAVGTVAWRYQLDTKNLTKGSHALAARAYDGTGYSEIATVNFEVEKPVAVQAQQNNLAVFAGIALVIVLAAAVGAFLLIRRKRGSGGTGNGGTGG